MSLKKWVQRRMLDVMFLAAARMDDDVIEEWVYSIYKKSAQQCPVCVDHGMELTPERLRRIEQEWVERGIIR